MNRFTTIVASLTFTCLAGTFAFAGPAPAKDSRPSASTASQSETLNAASETDQAASTDPANASLTPGSLPKFKTADINKDHLVNIDDLLAVINSYGQGKGSPADIAPAGGDGRVNIDDFLMVIQNWGA